MPEAPPPVGQGPLDLVVRGGTVVAPDGREQADVGIQGERIVAVRPGLPVGRARVIDAGGALVLPGVIDAHVHPIHAETVGSVSHAAAAGGVTTALHHVYPEPGRSMLAWLRELRAEASRTSMVDVGFHARLRADSPEHLGELKPVARLGIRTFKVFTAYRAPGVAVTDADLARILPAVRDAAGLVLVHAEDAATIAGREADTPAGLDDVAAYLRSRPDAAEATAIERVAEVARAARCPVYVVHVSSRAALGAIAAARAAGTRLAAETCPHHLLLTADALAPLGARAKVAPPLRAADDVAALWQGVRDGAIDVVASDHCGYAREHKEPPLATFAAAGMGAPGIETMLPLLLDAATRGLVTPERLVEALSAAPARLFGLRRKGAIAPGSDADLVMVDPGGTTVVDARRLHGAAYYSLHEGQSLRGAIRVVLLRGEPLSPDDGTAPRGRFLPTHPAVA